MVNKIKLHGGECIQNEEKRTTMGDDPFDVMA